MSSAAASQPTHSPSEQAAVKVFSNALGLSLSPAELNSGCLFRAVGGLCKYDILSWKPTSFMSLLSAVYFMDVVFDSMAHVLRFLVSLLHVVDALACCCALYRPDLPHTY